MGSTAPGLGGRSLFHQMFGGPDTLYTKAVTVRVSFGATGYDVVWQNVFIDAPYTHIILNMEEY